MLVSWSGIYQLQKAKLNGNKGLEAIAKLCINSPYGKWSYNPTKAKGSRIVTEPDDFFWYFCGAWNKVSINIINKDVAMAAVQQNTRSPTCTFLYS